MKALPLFTTPTACGTSSMTFADVFPYVSSTELFSSTATTESVFGSSLTLLDSDIGNAGSFTPANLRVLEEAGVFTSAIRLPLLEASPSCPWVLACEQMILAFAEFWMEDWRLVHKGRSTLEHLRGLHGLVVGEKPSEFLITQGPTYVASDGVLVAPSLIACICIAPADGVFSPVFISQLM